MIALSEGCNSKLQSKLSPKIKDPGRFSFSCTIGNLFFSSAFCSLGASVSLIPLTVTNKLRLIEIKPTKVKLQLPDRLIRNPRGILKNVLVKLDKFIIHIDFIMMDIKEDIDILIILDRPFLATTSMIIDVKNSNLMFHLGGEEVEINIGHNMKNSSSSE